MAAYAGHEGSTSPWEDTIGSTTTFSNWQEFQSLLRPETASYISGQIGSDLYPFKLTNWCDYVAISDDATEALALEEIRKKMRTSHANRKTAHQDCDTVLTRLVRKQFQGPFIATPEAVKLTSR